MPQKEREMVPMRGVSHQFVPCVHNSVTGVNMPMCRRLSSIPVRAKKCGLCKSKWRTQGIIPCDDPNCGLPSQELTKPHWFGPLYS